jgi:hypothetical protein
MCQIGWLVGRFWYLLRGFGLRCVLAVAETALVSRECDAMHNRSGRVVIVVGCIYLHRFVGRNDTDQLNRIRSSIDPSVHRRSPSRRNNHRRDQWSAGFLDVFVTLGATTGRLSTANSALINVSEVKMGGWE